ncbi:uncharacterized protein BXZ73DRAFT_40725 [Epithele typhae]|uniref:uncharacterized protein n=1 Tax=Epithele typhae TaxID=378194 RepID=UPI0020082F23|nr:uncharacterized protein BXZ73DRAFT_40725 [Epithele typhae]KAH9943055.1 hypothetical protein BXZ73DRAFT_40725 [Epithele typhae]
MTRYTNFARKRTYVEAGFDEGLDMDNEPENTHTLTKATEDAPEDNSAITEPKKRKRVRPKKAQTEAADGESSVDVDGHAKGGAQGEGARPSKHSKTGDKRKKEKKFDKRGPKEQRRLKRIDERDADTICFACREKGHSARNCTNKLAADAPDGERTRSGTKAGRDAVGICYRCGSRRHNLSKCPEDVNPSNPLPFASCFVCSGKGHLASKCPKNQTKGIYPNGGCCKLCKETTHLAKDCPLRKQEVATATLFVGTGQAAGADEDDFHTFKRSTVEVDKTERAEEKAKKKASVMVGAHTGVVKAFGRGPVDKKKVVFF